MTTIVLPISRGEFLNEIFMCLDQLDRELDTELLIVTDCKPEVRKEVEARLDKLHYNRIRVLDFGLSPATTIADRRWRISSIHAYAKNFIPENCDYVFLLEDDTLYPKHTLKRMTDFLDDNEDVGYIEAVELGRHNTPYIGAWIADNYEDPKTITSLMPENKNIIWEPISAGGLYCCLTIADLYKQHTFAPFDKKGGVGLSCDVNYGLYIRKKGYYCYIDWLLECDHLGEDKVVNIKNTEPKQVEFKLAKQGWVCNTK